MAHKVIVTHDGKFHADDVCAAATLLLYEKKAKIVRTRDTEKIAQADYAVDEGGEYAPERNRFDHHQPEGAGIRANKIPYAAFGLVWKQFGERIAGGKAPAEMIDRTLVQPLDAYDNGVALFSETSFGVFPYEFSHVIRALVPSWRENQDEMDDRFFEAVSLAQKILLREIETAQAEIEGARKVADAYRAAADKRLVVLDADYSWKETVARFPEPLFVAHPQDEQWFVESVRDNPHLFVNRKDLPESWAGLRDEELAKITGVSDAVFCHRNRFMAVARSREGVLALAKLALLAISNNQDTSTKQ